MKPLILDYISKGQALVHVGAHFAEERSLYQEKRISVMWVEACPLFSRKLSNNLAKFCGQEFRIGSLSKVSGLKTPFYISNNSEGVSSSFYKFGGDVDSLWPQLGLRHTRSLTVLTKTFDQFVEEEQHWFSIYDPKALLIDAQGAEVDILIGAKGSLWRFDIVQIEASSVNVYENGNTKDEVVHILNSNGFKLEESREIAIGHGDLLFRREKPIGNPDPAFSSKGYLDINNARIEHLASLELPLKNKTILELGSGPGDITNFLIEQGSYVTSIDARAENILAAKLKHQSSGRWNGFVYDLNAEIGPRSVSYDIVLAYGILYHLNNPRRFLKSIAFLEPSLLLLETCVTSELSSSKPNHPSGILDEDCSNGTQALNGTGCRPLRDWLWKLLKRNFSNSYVCKYQPDHPQFPIDWSMTANWETTLTRAIFVCSRDQLNYQWALSELPTCQSRKLFLD
jgi:SAM-dependent methyltransferase